MLSTEFDRRLAMARNGASVLAASFFGVEKVLMFGKTARKIKGANDIDVALCFRGVPPLENKKFMQTVNHALRSVNLKHGRARNHLHVIATSEWTQSEFMQAYGITEDGIQVWP